MPLRVRQDMGQGLEVVGVGKKGRSHLLELEAHALDRYQNSVVVIRGGYGRHPRALRQLVAPQSNRQQRTAA